VREDYFFSHSVGRIKSASLINHSNFLPTNYVGLNFILNAIPKLPPKMDREISVIIGYMGYFLGYSPSTSNNFCT
jgi:hypothetical protein